MISYENGEFGRGAKITLLLFTAWLLLGISIPIIRESGSNVFLAIFLIFAMFLYHAVFIFLAVWIIWWICQGFMAVFRLIVR